MFLNNSTLKSTKDYSDKIEKISKLINSADAIVVGAGSGLSSSAGLLYSGERFHNLFQPYIDKYDLSDMYSSAFYQHKTRTAHWGYWCKHIYHNRYNAKTNSLYKDLHEILKNKNFFVITTNGDHQFLLNDFKKEQLFYTQGDYGLFQCSKPCHQETYENEEIILKMVNSLENLEISSDLIPKCPKCACEMTVNLRMDGSFVEPKGFENASNRYKEFLEKNSDKEILFLELGVGFNTPSIIKYPFWNMTYKNEKATYVSVSLENCVTAKEITNQSILLSEDIKKVIDDLKK